MKRFLIGLLSGALILTACAPATVESTMPPSPSITPTIIPNTFTPGPTPIPPTQTITPLPTIPTFTPTFDARTIVTVTPAAKAECPKENLGIKPNFSLPASSSRLEDITSSVLSYLNAGGTLASVVEALQRTSNNKRSAYLEDVNGDSIPELITDNPYLWIAGCNSGKYGLLYFNPEASEIENLVSVRNLNLDNIAEVVFYDAVIYAAATFYRIFEWNGHDFVDIISNGETNTTLWYGEEVHDDDFSVGGSFTGADFQDIDKNGTEEFIVNIGIRGSYDINMPGPLRIKHWTYAWNGHKYILSQIAMDPPQYRFQAVQDGDLQTLQGNYSEATKLYQAVISSNKLDWWSKERFEQYRQAAINFTTPPVLAPDKTEYPRLAAYAYYRIMLLHFVQGQESEAEATYKTLQQKFGRNLYGRPYVEMATAFWSTYQSTRKMYDGCAAAIEYAAEHPDILIPLGSDYHGSQSHMYVPADVCPFR